MNSEKAIIQQKIEQAFEIELEESYVVGTGYGRARLPFSKEHIRSEILCHGLGAHIMYPETRTVLDIGGQDTKAIQVDPSGIVSSFQMNDRCAAGCGRYLGYIADEMNVGLHELGPMAMKATRTSVSTPPVPSLPEQNCGIGWRWEKNAKISLQDYTGDHSSGHVSDFPFGGISDQFTFTGGVANNEAAVTALKG